MKTTIHKAGKPSGLIQRCSLCGCELEKKDFSIKSLFERVTGWGWWKVDGYVEVGSGFASETNKVADCTIPFHRQRP